MKKRLFVLLLVVLFANVVTSCTKDEVNKSQDQEQVDGDYGDDDDIEEDDM
jgi:hypothetical protein